MRIQRRFACVVAALILACSTEARAQRVQAAPDLTGLWVGNVRMFSGVVRSLDPVLRQEGNRISGEWRKEEVEINPGKYAIVELAGTMSGTEVSVHETSVKEDRLDDLRWCNRGEAALSLDADGDLTGNLTCDSMRNPVFLRRIGAGDSVIAAQKTREKWVQTCSTRPVIDVMPKLATDYWRDPMVALVLGGIGSALHIRLADDEAIGNHSLIFASLSATNPGKESGSFGCTVTLFESITVVDRKTRKVKQQLEDVPEEVTYILTPSPEGFSMRVNAIASRVYSTVIKLR